MNAITSIKWATLLGTVGLPYSRSENHKKDKTPPARSHTIGHVKQHAKPKTRTPKLFSQERHMARELGMSTPTTKCYRASRHLSNNIELFHDLKEKAYDFATATGQTMRSEHVGTINIPLTNGESFKL